MRAITYGRVSTDEQAMSGLGLQAQRSTAEAACANRGWTVVAHFADEGVSGKVAPEQRPAFAEALDMLRTGRADVLVVSKLDRLTRSVRDLADLLERQRQRGCRWRLVALDADVDTTTAGGELVVNLMGSVAQWERRVIGERTRSALAVKRAQGTRLGRPVSTSPALRARVAALRAEGLSMSNIVTRVNDEGHRTSAGTPWIKSGIQRVLNGLALDAAAASARTDSPSPSA